MAILAQDYPQPGRQLFLTASHDYPQPNQQWQGRQCLQQHQPLGPQDKQPQSPTPTDYNFKGSDLDTSRNYDKQPTALTVPDNVTYMVHGYNRSNIDTCRITTTITATGSNIT